MRIVIENKAGGSHKAFNKLSSLAKYVAKNPVLGGYIVVNDVPEDVLVDAKKVIDYASIAASRSKDWEEVVEICLDEAVL